MTMLAVTFSMILKAGKDDDDDGNDVDDCVYCVYMVFAWTCMFSLRSHWGFGGGDFRFGSRTF